MSHLFFAPVAAVFLAAVLVATPTAGFAEEKIKDASPDGQFAMSVDDRGGGVVITSLVEAKTQKLLLKVG